MLISERREDALLARVVREGGGSTMGEEGGKGQRDMSELRPKLSEGGIHPEKSVPDRKNLA